MINWLKRLWFCEIKKKHKWKEIDRIMLRDLSRVVTILQCSWCGKIKKVYCLPPEHVNCRCYYDGL